MSGFGKSAAFCLAAVLACGAIGGQAQTASITLAPTGYITAGLGGTQQFTANVSGLANLAVTWAVGNVVGGNATLGTISPTGLYTAPAIMPASGQIQITAISQMTSTGVKGITWIYLLAAGPTITSVSPNPLPVGQSTVTITGSGFAASAVVANSGIQWSTVSITPTVIKANGYQPPATSATFSVRNPGTAPGNSIVVPVSGATSGTPNPPPNPPPGAPVVAPAAVTLALGATQQFSASNVTGWSATSGTITSAGLYTAPIAMPASGTDTVTATGAGGTGTAKVTLVSNVAPVILSLGMTPLPLGVFSTTIAGTGFAAGSTAQLNGVALVVTAQTATQLTVTGFAGTPGTVNLTVANGPVASQPFTVQVGIANPQVSPSAARRFLEQAAFGPTPTDAAHVQAIGFQAWLAEQFNLPVISNFNGVPASQGGMPQWFLANAVTNADQLRQRVAFALSQIFVVSIIKIIWNGDMIPYEQMLLADAFTNYRQILGDVTLSPGMGEYLDMANNAKANPAAGTAANENYAREIMQLMSIGTTMLNPDGSKQTGPSGPVPTYGQTDVTEQARVFTGWTYAPKVAGGQPVWGAYINSSGPMVPYPAQHDTGSKNLINGYVAPAGLSPQADLTAALDNLASHPNVAPFISKQLIQHLVTSNPSPGYIQRVANQFTVSNGDMKTVLTAILLDNEARWNDAGGDADLTDGHLQEPALMLPGYIRAFGGQMTTANYYTSNMAGMGQDIYNPASVFNYYSPGYVVAGTGGLGGPEFQIDNPNSAILRENLVATFFNQYSNPVQSNGPGTTVDLSPLLPLAAAPATLVAALDLTLTHGTMPAAMKQIIVNAVTADINGNLHRVQTGIYLILTSSYYNVWH
jgi:hypothetical protein